MQQPSSTANFSRLVYVGAGLGALKGSLDQPGRTKIDPETGEILPVRYTLGERALAIGGNAAVGAGLGLGFYAANLHQPGKWGEYANRLGRFIRRTD